MKFLFWSSLGVVFYTFFVYPIILVIFGSFSQVWKDLRFALNRRDRRTGRSESLPRVTLIIAAHNEESVIADKLRNCLELEYPADRLEILLGCDGCTDDTVAIASAAEISNLQIFDFERSGKPVTLNKLVRHATGDVLVFSDANTMYGREALQALVRHFRDGRVGAVCGELCLRSADGQPLSEGLYWKYECFLKFLEGRMNMLVGANGAIFAVRRPLYTPLPARTINDDFLTAMSIRARGYRVNYDPTAVAYEEAVSSLNEEFRRRVRIGRGNLRALKHTWQLLSPAAGLIALSYWSHKICRWLVPFALLLFVIAAVALAGDPLYTAGAVGGLLLITLAALGYFLDGRKASHPLFRFPCYFLVMNLALLIGFVKDAFGDQSVAWNPTARLSPTPAPTHLAGTDPRAGA